MSDRNMYECTPCPKCESRHRYGDRRREARDPADEVIRCDDCGHVEPLDDATRRALGYEVAP